MLKRKSWIVSFNWLVIFKFAKFYGEYICFFKWIFPPFFSLGLLSSLSVCLSLFLLCPTLSVTCTLRLAICTNVPEQCDDKLKRDRVINCCLSFWRALLSKSSIWWQWFWNILPSVMNESASQCQNSQFVFLLSHIRDYRR